MQLRSFSSTALARLRDEGPHPVPPRFVAKARLRGARKLHLGSGLNRLNGWANVDYLLAPGVVAHDLTRPLPVRGESISYIYSEHFIEHITKPEASALLKECFRVLEPGGVIRISTPNLSKLVEEYTAGRVDEWRDVDWKPSTPCQLLNEGMRLWGHQYLYDHEELTALLQDRGFTKVERAGWRESVHPDLCKLECRPFHDEVIVEATK